MNEMKKTAETLRELLAPSLKELAAMGADPLAMQAPLEGQVFMRVAALNAGYEDPESETIVELYQANVITSMIHSEAIVTDTGHKPVIDIDLPIKAIPSSTEGHFHLIIDKALHWDQYLLLLRTLAEIGIVEPGYVAAAERRGYTSVRLPWVPKELDPEENIAGGSL